ncbi:YceI family protein [Pseudoroseomonas sp. WGS1072]|uniref:YceI family protein n=1 Tax=Roseomonas sp. WGS1072 TaxID=3366816 RepID=UPI003BF11A71
MNKILSAGLLLAALAAAPPVLSPVVLSPVAAQPAAPFNRDPAAVRAGTYVLDSDHGKITWTVEHFGLSRYSGQLTEVRGELTLDPAALERSSLRVTIPMGKGGTLHEGLDHHLRSADFFDVERHPEARFVSTRIERTGERTARITGDLTLRGVTRPVSFEAVFNAAGVHPVSQRYTIGFDGRATLQRSQFGVDYVIPAVSDTVELHLEGEFQIVE